MLKTEIHSEKAGLLQIRIGLGSFITPNGSKSNVQNLGYLKIHFCKQDNVSSALPKPTINSQNVVHP